MCWKTAENMSFDVVKNFEVGLEMMFFSEKNIRKREKRQNATACN